MLTLIKNNAKKFNQGKEETQGSSAHAPPETKVQLRSVRLADAVAVLLRIGPHAAVPGPVADARALASADPAFAADNMLPATVMRLECALLQRPPRLSQSAMMVTTVTTTTTSTVMSEAKAAISDGTGPGQAVEWD
jgi:hypothetical protein